MFNLIAAWVLLLAAALFVKLFKGGITINVNYPQSTAPTTENTISQEDVDNAIAEQRRTAIAMTQAIQELFLDEEED